MHKQITSLQNPLLKQVNILLDKSRERRKQGLFIVEGVREIELALKGNYTIEKLLFCAAICPQKILEDIIKLGNSTIECIEITSEIYAKLAYRSTTEGLLAIVKTKETNIEFLKFRNKNPLLLIAEAPEKPGNIGAILRTADAARVDAVVIANPRTDLYNPNIIRSSVGCVFTNTIATGTTEEIIAFLHKNNIQFYSAILQDSLRYYEQDFVGPTAIVVGTEATGLSAPWREHSTANIHIPMQGEIDSMNVSVAAGILIFEAKRQRGFK